MAGDMGLSGVSRERSDMWNPLPEALSLPVDGAIWTQRNRFAPAAARLADRHYSREINGSPQVGGPGYVLIFVSTDERALWISKKNAETAVARVNADGFKGYRCTAFRNESCHWLASDMIRAAVKLTDGIWGPSPHGWSTYVDRTRIASVNPGYCFKQAGWALDRSYEHPRLVRLLLPPNVDAAA